MTTLIKTKYDATTKALITECGDVTIARRTHNVSTDLEHIEAAQGIIEYMKSVGYDDFNDEGELIIAGDSAFSYVHIYREV